MVDIINGEVDDNPIEVHHHHYHGGYSYPAHQDGTVTEYRDRVVTVRAIPWWWVALAAGVGLGLGFWFGRRRRGDKK